LDYEIEANKRVIVSNREVPGKIVETQPLKIDSSKIGEDMLVKIGRQQANNKSQDIQRVDARSGAAYESSHIKKAVNIDTKANFDKHRILQKNRS
jgi:hypothetical protein